MTVTAEAALRIVSPLELICPVGEDLGPGRGCIKEINHDGDCTFLEGVASDDVFDSGAFPAAWLETYLQDEAQGLVSGNGIDR